MWRHFLKHLAAGGLSLLALLVIAMVSLDTWYLWHFFPQTKIGMVDVGNLTQSAATQKMRSQAQPEDFVISLGTDEATISAQVSELEAHYDYENVVKNSLSKQQQLPTIQRMQQILNAGNSSIIIPLKVELDKELVTNFVTQLAKKIDSPGQLPMAQLGVTGSSNSLKIEPGALGRVVDISATAQLILDQPTTLVQPIMKNDGLELDDQQMDAAWDRANRLVGRQIVFQSENPQIRVVFDDMQLVSILAFPDGFNYKELAALVEAETKQHDQEAKDALFEYSPNTLAIQQFVPDEPGIEVDQTKVQSQLELDVQKMLHTTTPLQNSGESEAVQSDEEANEYLHTLPITITQPEITLAMTNDLGIQQLIGVGRSQYDHSIPSRIHNVSLATSLISNTLVAPGEEFSFNKTIGEVSRATGFQPAYVIKNGQTILGDGGGVCQVSTTLFRAALNTGLNITRRLPHSYRVGYYEQDMKPGVDATVYSGNTDLRFINDTPGYILIRGWADSDNLRMGFDVYGTSDGRSTEIVDHETWGASPPPAPVYQVDPSLPPGAKKQIDWSAPGLKAKFTNVVKDKNGEIIREQTFNSNYIPWSAKYLVGPE